jgi:hypothetical protein
MSDSKIFADAHRTLAAIDQRNANDVGERSRSRVEDDRVAAFLSDLYQGMPASALPRVIDELQLTPMSDERRARILLQTARRLANKPGSRYENGLASALDAVRDLPFWDGLEASRSVTPTLDIAAVLDRYFKEGVIGRCEEADFDRMFPKQRPTKILSIQAVQNFFPSETELALRLKRDIPDGVFLDLLRANLGDIDSRAADRAPTSLNTRVRLAIEALLRFPGIWNFARFEVRATDRSDEIKALMLFVVMRSLFSSNDGDVARVEREMKRFAGGPGPSELEQLINRGGLVAELDRLIVDHRERLPAYFQMIRE